LALAAGGLGALAGCRQPQPPPNLLLISIDTLRADHLSLDGYPRPTTPRLDRFAADALVFDRSYASSTWTLPSHGSMLTGLLPDQHGLRHLPDRLSPEVPTLAGMLRDAGYRTAGITDGGFLGPQWGFASGFDSYEVSPGQPWEPKDVAPIAAKARRWLEAGPERPFFLFVHTYEVHQPYRNVEGFADPFLEPGIEGRYTEVANVFARPPPTDEQLPRVIALYDGGVHRADHYIGGLLEWMGEAGLLDDTAVVVTSDHGEEFREHGHLEHAVGSVFDENLRVPLIVRPPGGTGETAPRRIATPVTGLDVTPTLLALAGLPPPPGAAGRSLRDVAADPPEVRTVVMDGINSLPELNESRLRLDRGDATVVVDRVRNIAVHYDRAADPEMRRPVEVRTDRGPVRRMQETLVWLGPGPLAACLPAGLAAVSFDPGSRLVPQGLWNGLTWVEPPAAGDGAVRLALDPARRACLALAVRPGAAGPAGRAVRVEGAVSGPLRLAGPVAADPAAADPAATDPGRRVAWRPLGELPLPEATLVVTGDAHAAEQATLDSETEAELRALGYLR
jgi:arylsulfatase A-like enzyme